MKTIIKNVFFIKHSHQPNTERCSPDFSHGILQRNGTVATDDVHHQRGITYFSSHYRLVHHQLLQTVLHHLRIAIQHGQRRNDAVQSA